MLLNINAHIISSLEHNTVEEENDVNIAMYMLNLIVQCYVSNGYKVNELE